MFRKLYLVLLLFVLGYGSLLAQLKLELVNDLAHKGSFPKNECIQTKDKKGYCAVIDVMIPLSGVEFKQSYIQKVEKIKGGYRLFVSPSKKSRQIQVLHDNYVPLEFTFGGNEEHAVVGMEAYQVVIAPPTDVNLGKAYLSLASNVENVKVLIEGPNDYRQELLLADGQLEEPLNLPYGVYNCTFTKKGYFDLKKDAVLKDKPVSITAEMETIDAHLHVNKEHEIDIWVDGRNMGNDPDLSLPVGEHKIHTQWGTKYLGKSQRINLTSQGATLDMPLKGSLTINTNARNPKIHITPIAATAPREEEMAEGEEMTDLLGLYDISISKYGRVDKSFTVEVGANEHKSEHVLLKHSLVYYSIFQYTYAPKAPIGITLAWVKRWGFYVTGQCSTPSFLYTIGKGSEDNGQQERIGEKYMDLQSVSSLSRDMYEGLEPSANFRGSVTCGLMLRWVHWIYLFGGGGYGNFTNLYNVDDIYYKGQKFKGPEAEGGVMIRLGGMFLSGRYTQMFNTEQKFGDVSISLGFRLN